MLLLGELRRMARRVIALTAAAQLLLWCAACGGFWPGSGTTSPHLLSLTVSPNPFQVALGSTGQAKATGTFSDGTERDLTSSVSWTVEGANIASISSTGVIRPNSTGAGFLRAVYETVSTKAPLTITAAPLVSLAINPSSPNLPLGLGVQLKAIGQYADSSTGDVTSQVNWSSGSTTIATVGPSGQAVSRSLGVTTISASMGNVQASAALSVTAAALTAIAVTGGSQSLAIGQKTQMHALGSFTDGSRQDLTASAQWTSSNPKVVAVNNAGLAVASSQGSATIAASVQSLSAASPLSVTSAGLTAIAVSSDSPSVPVGRTTQMHAIGSYTDGSQQDLTASVQWTSSNPKVVAVNNAGLATASSQGSATIAASVQSLSAASPLSVISAALTAIAVSSDSTSVPVGRTTQMHAIGSYTDGSQQDLTASAQWTSSNPKVVAVNNAGLAVASSQGSATIAASMQSLSAASPLSVTSAALVSLSVTPSSSVILLGSTLQLLVTGTYTDGSTADLTANSTWNSSDLQTVSVDSHGMVYAFDVGNAQATASYQNQQASAGVTVQPTQAVSRFVLPPNGVDTTLRIVSPGAKRANVCAMIYVFDQNQQMSECCGCNMSPEALLALSYPADLLANPLTGIQSAAGTVVVISADHALNPNCDASNIAPSGSLHTWSTAPQKSGHQSYVITETPGLDAPLADTELANIQAQCAFVKILGSGQGQCSCGNSPAVGH